MSKVQNGERNEKMFVAYLQGATSFELSEEYDLSVGRVQQIMSKCYRRGGRWDHPEGISRAGLRVMGGMAEIMGRNDLPSKLVERNNEIYQKVLLGRTYRDVANEYELSCNRIRLLMIQGFRRGGDFAQHLVKPGIEFPGLAALRLGQT